MNVKARMELGQHKTQTSSNFQLMARDIAVVEFEIQNSPPCKLRSLYTRKKDSKTFDLSIFVKLKQLKHGRERG